MIRLFGFGLLAFATSISTYAQDATSETMKPLGEVTKVHGGFAFTEGPARDPDGGYFFTDIPNQTIHHVDADGKLTVFTKDSKFANGLMVAADGRLLACQMAGQLVAYDRETGDSKVLANAFDGVRMNAPNDMVIDTDGGIYFTDPRYRAPEPWPQGIEAVYYVTRHGTVSRVTDALPAPNGIGLSPDGKQLYVATSAGADMMVYDVAEPGKLSEGKVLCTITQPGRESGNGSDGITLDVDGNLYFTTKMGIEIVSPAGKSLRIVPIPEHPANVTFAGKDRKTMVVTARTSVYEVKMPIAGLPAH